MTYVLSLSWPGSTCNLNHCKYLGKKNYFSVHGLWPESKQDCYNVHFKERDFSKQNQKDISLYWSSMYNSEMKFINHELSKHGSCWEPKSSDLSKVVPEFRVILEKLDVNSINNKINGFVEMTMAWSKKYNIKEILEQYGIRPSDNDGFHPVNIVKALESYFGFENAIFPVCRSKNHLHYFSEIRFCLDNNYRLTTCQENVVKNHINSCGKNMMFPEFPVL